MFREMHESGQAASREPHVNFGTHSTVSWCSWRSVVVIVLSTKRYAARFVPAG